MAEILSIFGIKNALSNAGGLGVEQLISRTDWTTTAGGKYSMWRNPSSGGPMGPLVSIPTATWVTCTKKTTGAFNFMQNEFPASSVGRVLEVSLNTTQINQVYTFVDRLGHCGGILDTLGTAQTVNAEIATAASQGRCQASGSDVEWWLEVYSQNLATSNTANINVTYNDDTTGVINTGSIVSSLVGRVYTIIPGSGNRSIKSIQSVTMTGPHAGTGNFGITAVKKMFRVMSAYTLQSGNQQASDNTRLLNFGGDWQSLGFPPIYNDTCLAYCLERANGTLSGFVRGEIIAGVP